MYSLVLMAALTSGSSAPDGWFHGHSHHGGHGYSGCAGYGCAGCYGGYAGWGCTGCYGGYYNGGGGYGGCFGCYGGSWGHGGGWGYGGGGGLDYSCFGCHGCYGTTGPFFGCTGYAPGAWSGMPPELIPPPKVEEKKGGGTGSLTPDRAKVIVQLPSDAKLYVDEQPIKAAERQTFSTPRLDRGQTYFYDVRAEAVRDGKTVVETKRVLVRAGEEVTVSFPKLDAPPTVAAADLPRRP